jgi:outer membrane protein
VTFCPFQFRKVSLVGMASLPFIGRRSLPVSVICAIFFGFIAQVSPVLAMDLLDAWRLARTKDPQLAIARFQLDAVKERVVIARSLLASNVSASGSVTQNQVDTNKDIPKSFVSQIYSVNLNYPLYRKPATEALEQSKLVNVQTDLQANYIEQDLMLRVAQAYTDVLAAQDAMRAAQTQRRAALEQFNVIRRSFSSGGASRLDLQDATARSDISQAQEAAARNELLSKRASLQVLTGASDFELLRVKPNIALNLPDQSQTSAWVQQARSANLLVQQAELGVEIAKREVTKQNAGHKATVDLIGSVGRSNNASVAFIGVNQTTAQLGLQFNLPIYSGGGIDAKTREAIALFNKANSELDSIRDQSEQNVRQALVRLNSGSALVQALTVAVESSKVALEVTQKGFLGGARVNIDVLNALQQVFNTSRDLARARYDLLLDSLKLKQAAGNLKLDDLSALNGLLLPLESSESNPPSN